MSIRTRPAYGSTWSFRRMLTRVATSAVQRIRSEIQKAPLQSMASQLHFLNIYLYQSVFGNLFHLSKIVILLTFLHCHIQLPKGWRRKNRLGGGLTTTRRAGLKSRTASMTLTILRWRWQQRTLRWGESHRRPAPVAAEPTITISNHPPRIRCRSFEAVARSHKQLFDHKVITSSLSFPSFL